GPANEIAQSAALIEAQQPCREAHRPEILEQPPDQHRAPEPRPPGARRGHRAHDLGARRLEDPPVLDAGRAHRLARAAVEALRLLVHEAGAQQVETLFGDRFDQRDAAAGTGRLDQGFDIRRTRRQTETAADAAVEDVGRRDVGRDEASAGFRFDHDDPAFAGAKREPCRSTTLARAARFCWTAAIAPPRDRCSTPPATTTRSWRSPSCSSRTRGPTRCRATSTCGPSPTT